MRAVILLAALATACESDKPAAESSKSDDVAKFFAQPATDATAKQFIDLWRTNEVAAREKYFGRPLRLDGHVDRVAVESVDGRSIPTLYFAEGGVCAFNWGTPPPELSKLRRGQRVIVLGQPRGARTGVVHLTSHCSIESVQ